MLILVINLKSLGYLKLIDFGNAKVSNGKTRTICGTAYYMAPEMTHGKRYGRAADWWSFGIILYEMLQGLNAFKIKVSCFLSSKTSDDNVDTKGHKRRCDENL